MSAVARHAPVGRLQPDHAAERGRLADRAAGVGAERERRPCPAATAAAAPPEEPPGTRARSHGLRVVKNAEFSVDEPIANSSMLSLPSSTAPAVEQPRDHGGVVGRHEALQDLRAAGGADPARAEHVLDRDRHPVERPERRAGRESGRRLPRRGASASSRGHGEEGANLADRGPRCAPGTRSPPGSGVALPLR